MLSELRVSHLPYEYNITTFPEVEPVPDGFMVATRPMIKHDRAFAGIWKPEIALDQGVIVAAGSKVPAKLGTEVLLARETGMYIENWKWRDFFYPGIMRVVGSMYRISPNRRAERKRWYNSLMAAIEVTPNLTIRPFHDKILVERVELKEHTANGIHVPRNATRRPTICRIVALPGWEGVSDKDRETLSVQDFAVDQVWFYSSFGVEVPIKWVIDDPALDPTLALVPAASMLLRLK